MKIIRKKGDYNLSPDEYKYFHIVTFADDKQNSLLNLYGSNSGIDTSILKNFSEVTNNRDEAGGLFPKANISCVPQKYITDLNNVSKLKNHIIDILDVNMNHDILKFRKMLFDFRNAVSAEVIEVIENSLKEKSNWELDEVIIVEENKL